MKYLNTMIGFREFPNEISLLINITNCPYKCEGCHSPELRRDIGTELTLEELEKLIDQNPDITCIGFMGGSHDEVVDLITQYVDKYILPDYNFGWYTGTPLEESPFIFDTNFTYIKFGPYIEELGGLDSPTTNQRMLYLDRGIIKEYKFYEH